MAKLTSMHFYAWKSGLKTGMYYLRTKSAVDAKKFTVTRAKKQEPVAVEEKVSEPIVQKQQQAAETAAKFAKEKEVTVSTEPLSPEEMKALIAQAKEAEGDDCLMCGS